MHAYVQSINCGELDPENTFFDCSLSNMRWKRLVTRQESWFVIPDL